MEEKELDLDNEEFLEEELKWRDQAMEERITSDDINDRKKEKLA